MLLGVEDELGDLGGAGVGQAAVVDVGRHLGGPLRAGQVDQVRGRALVEDMVGLEVAVRPPSGVQRRELDGDVGDHGEPGGAVVAAVGAFQGVPQGGAVDPAQLQPGTAIVGSGDAFPAVVAVELGAQQAQDLALASGHQPTGDLQGDAVDPVDGRAVPVVQEFGVVVVQPEAGDDAIP